MNLSKTQILSLLFALILIGIVIVAGIMSFGTSPQKKQPQPTLAAPTLHIESGSLNINSAPTAPLDQGGGTDVNSSVVINSKSEIEILYPFLPFELDFIASNNINVNIIIPDRNLQTNTHTLRAQVFGIDYQVTREDPNYEIMKKSFIEAANTIFTWIKENNADPEKIIFVWGDKTFIQEQAVSWLNSNN